MAKRRKRGTGSIHLRNDGRWEGRCLIGYDEKGLPKTKNVLAKTKSECIEKLKVLQQTLAAPTPSQAKPRMTVREWLDFWYQTHKKPTLRPNTQMSYEQRIYGHIIPALGSIPLDKLRQNDLQQFYTNLKQSGRRKDADRYGEGLSDQTVRGCHTTLRSTLAKAVEEKLIIRNPADGCRLPSAKPREMQVLTPEEMQRLLIQAKEDGCYELLLLELSTGLRRGEILALQWDDLNFNTYSPAGTSLYIHDSSPNSLTACLLSDRRATNGEETCDGEETGDTVIAFMGSSPGFSNKLSCWYSRLSMFLILYSPNSIILRATAGFLGLSTGYQLSTPSTTACSSAARLQSSWAFLVFLSGSPTQPLPGSPWFTLFPYYRSP